MNAYELADDAKNISNAIEALEFVQKAVPMLRQQADRIAELEELLKIDGDEIKILQFLLKEKQSKQIGVYDGKDLHIYTPQTKPLSDEEIEEVIRKHWNKEYGNRNMLTLCKAVLAEANK